MISIKGLRKSYGSNEVLKGIDLELSAGKVYGVVGENGAGKTTLFRCLAGLEKYDGDINSDFIPLKKHLGFLPTNPLFLSKITAWEYLKLMCVARNIEEDDFHEQNIFDLPLNDYAENYSTGMKKKLALMGTLLQKNDVYIFDEPFNGVDINSNMMIQEIIKTIKASNNCLIISSHIFSTLKESCDEIHLLKEGRITKSATAQAFVDIENEMKAKVTKNTKRLFRSAQDENKTD